MQACFMAHLPGACHFLAFPGITPWINLVFFCFFALWPFLGSITALNCWMVYHRIILLFRWIIAPSFCHLVKFVKKRLTQNNMHCFACFIFCPKTLIQNSFVQCSVVFIGNQWPKDKHDHVLLLICYRCTWTFN